MTAATAWLRAAVPGDPGASVIVDRLVALAGHGKWEVRRAVANAAARTMHTDFDTVLSRLAADHNAQVRQAAESAILRRRDWGSTGALGKQHEQHLNATLDDIEARFGVRGRQAVKRAAEHIANTFVRELHHEVVKILSPLSVSADRLVIGTEDDQVPRAELAREAVRVRERVARVLGFLDAMRTYAAQPKVVFSTERIRDVVDESVSIIRDGYRAAPEIAVDVPAGLEAEVCRSRLVQALTNLVVNAVEAYKEAALAPPIEINASAEEGRIIIAVRDHGCGMNEEVLADATLLFATSKEKGTGFGLPLVVKVVETEHGGRLQLQSRPGEGTTAVVIIPARPQRDGR